MTLGWYVHHHGQGHATTARCVLPHLDRVTVLTSVDADWPVPSVRLEPDVAPGGPDDPRPTPDGRLHHAPLAVGSATTRAATLVGWLDEVRPDLLVIDVSVEVTLLCRLSAIPPVVMRSHGDRNDPAHRTGFDAAVSLLAPYPEFLEDPATPDWVRDRTTYVGGFSRSDGRDADGGSTPWTGQDRTGEDPHVVALSGAGGEGLDGDAVAAAATATPEWSWHVLGGAEFAAAPANLEPVGWVDDVHPYLTAADVVVATAGHNTVMEVAAARRPLVCIPEQRPFDEQEHRAQVLAAEGLAIVRDRWPPAADWPGLLEQACALGTGRWHEVVDGHGAERAAAHLRDVAGVYR